MHPRHSGRLGNRGIARGGESQYGISPLYKFFNKKSIVQDFLMYNEFATTITKESDPVR